MSCDITLDLVGPFGPAPAAIIMAAVLDGTEFCWTLSWQGIADPVAGHVHLAPRGVAGPIVIDLDTDDVVGPDASGCRVITADLAADITSDAGAYYVNLHNAGFQAGAIRGQLK
jgi:hypothetical protein